MDFRGADINNVLKFFAMATNWEIVPDAGLTGPVTIVSPKQLTTDQAFQVLQAVLEIRGYSGQLETRGNTQVLRIVPLDRAVTSTRNLTGPAVGPDGEPLPPDKQRRLSPDELKNQVVTEVFPIENVDASTLSRELQPLINKGASIVGSSGSNALIVTDTASNVARIGTLVDMLDRAASSNEIERYPLHNADATDVANAINGLFKQVFTRGRGGQPQPGQPGQPPMPQPQPQPGQPGVVGADSRAAVVAVADTRTNSVIVVASSDNMKRVKALIEDLDDPGAQALDTYWRKLKYADAGDVADTINSILSGTTGASSRQGGASFGQRVFGGGFGPFGGPFGGFGQQQQSGQVQSTDPFAKVVANVRTNTLVIMATKERMTKIDDLIKELDVEVPTESTTFVIPLKNAQAQDLATTLSQAFGTGGTGGGGFGINIFGGNPFGSSNQRRNQGQGVNRRIGQTSNSPFGRAAGGTRAAQQAPGAQAASDGIHGTMTQGGFVPDPNAPPTEDDPVTRQFGFPFGGRFGQSTQMQTPQYGRGSAGRYVNLLQLRQNVGVTADVGSNSLIITTTPDNMKSIQEIIDSLDVVPRQVMIEVIIAEATLDSTQKLGFQFDVNGVGRIFGSNITQSGSSNFPLGGLGTTAANIAGPLIPGAQYGIQAVSGRFNALVQALATDNRIKILSTPKVFTSNNMEATIDITTNVPYQNSSFNSTFGASVSYSYLPVGVTLDVTPRITADGQVTMDLDAIDSELLGFDSLTSAPDSSGHTTTVLAPRYANRETTTTITAKDGEIVALGGLMRNSTTINVNKVPLLSQIPILGALFRSTNSETIKSELMLFMIPHVVDSQMQSRKVTAEQAQGTVKAFPELGKTQPGLLPPGSAGDSGTVKNPPRGPVTPQTPPQDDKKQ